MTRQTYEEYRASGALATLEDDWIAEISSNPTDIDWFLSIAQALAAAGEEERARSRVELYDSELESQKLWATRLELLRRGGTLAVKHSKLQREVQATLEALWGDRPSFRAMFEHVGLHKNIDQTTKLWDRAARLQSLLVYEVGEVVAMAGQGVGRIAEVNLPLENLKMPQGAARDRVLQHRWRTGHCLPARVGQRPGCLVAGTGPEFLDAKEV